MNYNDPFHRACLMKEMFSKPRVEQKTRLEKILEWILGE